MEGIRPQTPLELLARAFMCARMLLQYHNGKSALRDEVERYGPYSLAARVCTTTPSSGDRSARGLIWRVSVASIPMNGIAIARMRPKSCCTGSVCTLQVRRRNRSRLPLPFADDMRVLRATGVPYTEEMITRAQADLTTQATLDDPDEDSLRSPIYANINVRNFGGKPGRITEADALILYLQRLGTHRLRFTITKPTFDRRR